MRYNNKWLIDQFDQDSRSIKFLYFWGHQPAKDGSVTKSCFSQWWVSPFEIDGTFYSTAEHWMMACKARMFNDNTTLEKILKAATAPEAKKLGREVQHFDPQIWDKEKYNAVVKGNLAKFSSSKVLKEFLIKTGDQVIVEASPVDSIWGIGLAAEDVNAGNPSKWKGENLLGYALMEVRDILNGKQ